MDYVLRFAYPLVLYIGVPILCIAALYRWMWYKHPRLRYSLSSYIQSIGKQASWTHRHVLFGVRFCTLALLVLLVARPQWVDPRSRVEVEGVDIMLVFDVSGSMQLFDDLNDRRMRVEVAKEEAIRFIEKRLNDPIGVVLFAGTAISRCPLTLDKHMLKEIVGSLELGVIDSQATMMGSGLGIAVNRLRTSSAKSKVIILLTDGVPTADKVSPEVAADLAAQFGIKIYAIGIGNDVGGYVAGPFGMVRKAQVPLDMNLLKTIADKTGGRAFQAQNPQDMRRIYDTINTLETTKIETTMFHHYHEAYGTFMWLLLLLVALELGLRGFVWRGILC